MGFVHVVTTMINLPITEISHRAYSMQLPVMDLEAGVARASKGNAPLHCNSEYLRRSKPSHCRVNRP